MDHSERHLEIADLLEDALEGAPARHLAACASCQRRRAEHANLGRLVRSLPRKGAPRGLTLESVLSRLEPTPLPPVLEAMLRQTVRRAAPAAARPAGGRPVLEARPPRRLWIRRLAAAAAVLVVGLFLWQLLAPPGEPTLARFRVTVVTAESADLDQVSPFLAEALLAYGPSLGMREEGR